MFSRRSKAAIDVHVLSHFGMSRLRSGHRHDCGKEWQVVRRKRNEKRENELVRVNLIVGEDDVKCRNKSQSYQRGR